MHCLINSLLVVWLIDDVSLGRLLVVKSFKTLFILIFSIFDCTKVTDEGSLELYLVHLFKVERVWIL